MRQIVYISDQLPRIRRVPLDFFRDRDLVWTFIRRNALLRHRSFTLAAAWAIAEPLLLSFVLLAVFTVIVDLRPAYPELASRARYLGLVLCATVPWIWTAAVLRRAAVSLVEQAPLIRHASFAREAVPMAVVISAGGAFLLAGLVLFGYLTAAVEWPTQAYAALPIVLVIHAVLLSGAALLLALGGAYFRDLKSLVRVVISVGFFLSPVFYTGEMVQNAFDDSPIALGWAKPVYYTNPMVGLIEAYREIMVWGRFPTPDILIWPTVASLATLGLGLVLFRRHAPKLADIV